MSISYASDDIVQLRRRVRRRHRRLHRRGHAPRSRTTATPRRLDRPRAAGGQPGQRERLDRRRRRRTRRRASASSPRTRSTASRRSSRSSRACSARTRSPRPAASSTTSTASASRSRSRPGRSTRKDFFHDRDEPVDAVVVHELAHQWFGDDLALAALAAHLAQRGLRDLRRVAVERGAGPRHRAGDASTSRSPRPGRRPVLGGRDRRSRPGATLRQRRLRPRRDDAARAAAARSATPTSSGCCAAGPRSTAAATSTTAQFTALAERVSGPSSSTRSSTTWLFTGAKPAGLEGAQRRASASETSQSSRRAAGSYATWSARASRRPTK